MVLAALKQVSNFRSFNGQQKVLQHFSNVLQCDMKFGIYLPDHNPTEKLPVLFYLSGLTCTEANFIEKSGFQRFASANKIIVVNPDTSPRGVKVEGDDASYDIGTGAGFYMDATQPKWSKHYRMYSYVVNELVPLIFQQFSVDSDRCGIFGHSMGGHGALTIGLKNPSVFKSISTFAAICNPIAASISQKAFNEYLGANSLDEWKKYDAFEVAKVYKGPKRTVLLDQGTNDEFYKSKDLLPENLTEVKNPNLEFQLVYRPNYEHAYFYVATFMEEHFKFHLNSWMA